jgi:hypothetical protein
MITTPTVLVLGAGASYPYGFPTAAGLRQDICHAFEAPDTNASVLIASYAGGDIDRERVFEFRQAFLKSGQPSIDAFLDRRSEFLHIGKLAIAYCLIPYESEQHLYARDHQRGGDWYQYLALKLIPHSRTSAKTALASSRLTMTVHLKGTCSIRSKTSMAARLL